jgi:hypothetical protein
MRQASLSLISFAVLCSFAKTSLGDEKAETIKAPPQLQAAVDRLTAIPVLSHWPVHHIDQQPSVEIHGLKGYRIVLRSTWKQQPADSGQQSAESAEPDDASAVAGHTDWHFVLFPLGWKRPLNEAKREILWPVPDEKEFRLPVALGEGDGFAWFTYATIPQVQLLHEQLALAGGDDPFELAVRGLSFERQGLGFVFLKFGDKGFDRLIDVVQFEGDAFRISSAVRSMAAFRDARSTARLVELYFGSPNPGVRRAVAKALINQPPRPEAGRAYIPMVSGELHPTEAVEICLELGLKDALPAVAAIVEKPSSLRQYLRAYEAFRQLSDKPIDAKLIEAEKVIRSQSRTQEEFATARRAIVESPDVEGAVYVALSWAACTYKGSHTAEINKDGVAMLQQLPRPVVENLFGRLANGSQESDSERKRILALSHRVLGPAETER